MSRSCGSRRGDLTRTRKRLFGGEGNYPWDHERQSVKDVNGDEVSQGEARIFTDGKSETAIFNAPRGLVSSARKLA